MKCSACKQREVKGNRRYCSKSCSNKIHLFRAKAILEENKLLDTIKDKMSNEHHSPMMIKNFLERDHHDIFNKINWGN